MVVAIVSAILLLLCLAVVVAVATDRGPSPEDVAVSYEYAWDRLDFPVLFTLSAAELRDGLDRKQFVAAKRAAYAERTELGGLAANVVAEDVTTRGANAIVTTRVTLRDGSTVRNAVQLVRRSARWQVSAYALSATAPGVVAPRSD